MTLRLVSLPTPSGAFNALLGEPTHSTGPAVILLPEIYNLNDWIQAVAERYVAAGYVVLVPDLFWRHEPAVDLPYSPEGQVRGRALSAVLDRGIAADDIGHAASWLKTRYGAINTLAVGFCLGGELAVLAAAQGYVDAASAYYPTRMQDHLHLLSKVDVPLQVHIGELDHRTPPDLVDALRRALPQRPDVEVFVYTGADHGFGRFGHPPHHHAAEALAEQRTHALAARMGHDSRADLRS